MWSLFRQFMRFCVIGGFCFLVDFVTMVLLTELAGLNYLLSCALSFLLSTFVNYRLSVRYVFRSREDMERRTEFLIYLLLSALGLGLTELLMWLGVDCIGIHYMLTKIIVTAIVMVYNFVTRKLFLEGRGTHREEGEGTP